MRSQKTEQKTKEEKKNPRIRNRKQQRNIMRKQQKCVYVRFFSPSNNFFSLCARSVKSRDLLRQLRHSLPNCTPRPAHVLHNGCGDGTCKSGERGEHFCPMSACSYKYYVYAVADAAQGKRTPICNLYARHLYIRISIDSRRSPLAYPLAGLAGFAPRQARVHRDGDD